MNYILRLAVLDPAPELPISEADAAAAVRARTVLNAAFALEETYDLLLSNFLELDQEALRAAATSVVLQRHTYEELFEVRASANRRVVNLLTAARLYLDHAPQHLAVCANNPDHAKRVFKEVASQQYDARFSYRFMEALRNHVQHSGLAVHTVKHASRWTGAEPDTVLETCLELFSDKELLKENEKFHGKTLAEMPPSVELLRASREYLEGLGQVHIAIRAIIEAATPQARQVTQALIDSYASVNEGRTSGLSVLRVEGVERETVVPVFLKWDDVRLKLAKRNSTLGNLGRRVATSRLGLPMRRQ